MEKDEQYGLDLSREEVDVLRRIADNGCGGYQGPTLERLERLGYLTPPDLTGSRRVTAKGEMTVALVR
ncbi:MAG: hypothetical protein ABW067_09290 [Rhizobacter sp.]